MAGNTVAIPAKLVPFVQGDHIINASDAETTGNSNVQTDLTTLFSSIFGWNFSDSVDGTNPGAGNVAFNNAVKDNTSVVTFNTQSASDSARFDEMLGDINIGDRLFFQEQDAINNSILFRVTEEPNTVGTRVDLTVTRERDQGGEFTPGGRLNTIFFFTGGDGAASLPAAQTRFLNNTAETDLEQTTVTNINDTVNDVLIWRRAALVTQVGISDPGTGLLISEANRQPNASNGDPVFNRESGTSVYDDDLANAYIYIGITTNDFNNLTLSETFLEARRAGELVFSSSLEDLTTPVVTIGQFQYRRTTNNQYHYINGDILTVVTRSTTTTGQEYTFNTPQGDFTQNIDDLPFSAVDSDFTGRVAGPSGNQELTAADTVKLTGLLVDTTISAEQPITVSYKNGEPTGDLADYDQTWDAANPVLANFGSERILSIVVNNNVTVTSVSGGATLGPQLLWIPRHYVYRVTLPAEAGSGTPTSHLPSGISETFLPTGFNENYKIARNNVVQSLLAAIDAHSSDADIATLESKVNALFPLTPNVIILNDWAGIYNPSVVSQEVTEATGYDSFIDYRSDAVRYESDGINYGTGAGVITYTGLTENLHRLFGFSIPQANEVTLTGSSGTANIGVDGVEYLVTFNTDLTTTASDFVTTHSAALSAAGVTVTSDAAVLRFVVDDPRTTLTITNAVNATGNLAGTVADIVLPRTLLWIVDGGTNIPFIDVTGGGNFRINRYRIEESAGTDVSNQFQFLTRTGGTDIVTTAGGSFSQFTIPNFPTGSTNRSRSLQIEIDVLVNSVDTGAGHFQDIALPALNTAATIQTFDASIYLGPLHGNRTVNVTIGYTLTAPGANLLVDLTLETAPGDVSVRFTQVNAIFNYTAANVQSRVDDFTSFSDALGVHTFTGAQELIVSFDPVIPQSPDVTGSIEAIGVALNTTTGVATQFNNLSLSQPEPLWTDIEVTNTVQFRSFAADHYLRHSEIATFITRAATQWAYGFALLREVTGHAVTEAIDLAAGSTLGGAPIVGTGIATTTIVNNQAVAPPTAQVYINDPGTGSPYNTTDFDYLYIELDDGTQVYATFILARVEADIRLQGAVRIELGTNNITSSLAGDLTVIGWSLP